MRHGVKGKHLGRKAAHRKATLSALCTALFLHKRIQTTVTKAKESRKFAESLITTAKGKDHHAYMQVFRTIKDKNAIQALFGEIVEKVGTRAGGYTRVVKLGQRLGDGAEVAVLELVDFNVSSVDEKPKTTGKTEKATKTEEVATEKPKKATKKKKEESAE